MNHLASNVGLGEWKRVCVECTQWSSFTKLMIFAQDGDPDPPLKFMSPIANVTIYFETSAHCTDNTQHHAELQMGGDVVERHSTRTRVSNDITCDQTCVDTGTHFLGDLQMHDPQHSKLQLAPDMNLLVAQFRLFRKDWLSGYS